MAKVSKSKISPRKKMQSGGEAAPYKPLSKKELSALAHQYRAYADVDRYKYNMPGGTSGALTRRETEQLKAYMNSRNVGQKIWEALPNLRGERGEAALPKNSRLADEYRTQRRLTGSDLNKALDIWESQLERMGYKNGGKIAKKLVSKKAATKKTVKKSAPKKSVKKK